MFRNCENSLLLYYVLWLSIKHNNYSPIQTGSHQMMTLYDCMTVFMTSPRKSLLDYFTILTDWKNVTAVC